MTSVLKYDFEPLANINGIMSQLGSRVISISMFDSSKEIAPYPTGNMFNFTLNIMSVSLMVRGKG